jgi:fucose permease
VAAITLYVIKPRRRNTAEAVSILVTHLFGDAASPYLVGVVSDILHKQYGYNDVGYS